MEEVLVTYGPTRAPLDAVRYLCNASSGRLGALLIRQLASEGFRVFGIRGPGAALPRLPAILKAAVAMTDIETVQDLIEVTEDYLSRNRPFAIIHAMAVLDYVPETTRDGKTSSSMEEWWIRLKPTPKVVKIMRRLAPESLLVSFKLECELTKEELLARAVGSLDAAGADYVVANDLREIHGDRHKAFIVNRRGEVLGESKTKQGLARSIVDLLKKERS